MTQLSHSRWRIFLALTVVAAVASIASVPVEIRALADVQPEVPWWAPIVAFLFGFIPTVAAVAIGVLTVWSTSLDVPVVRRLVDGRSGLATATRSILLPSVTCAIVGFLVLHVAGGWLSSLLVPELAQVDHALSLWHSLLLSFSAGIREELIFRFGLMTFLVWLGVKLLRLRTPNALLLWTANGIAVIPFALAHILSALGLGMPITPGLVVFILIANGAVGLMFGWLYMRYGIASAMLAHVCYDLMQFLIWPLINHIVGLVTDMA